MPKLPKTLPHPNINSPTIAGAPKCPKELSKEAKKKWKEMIALLQDNGTLTRLDGDLLACYCEAHARRQRALMDVAKNGDVLGQGTSSFQNPALAIANKAMDQIMRLSKLLGIDKLTLTKLGKGKAGPRSIPARDRSKGPPPPSKKTGGEA